ncbi:protein mono-ADP-ribosyltransferase PARP14-like isoform X2 [Anneissia japonica]|uniref:protein mono-ADP-ribosyltransferase PARP14-like isoform X2 n=1 Tax=Anneissia japonica TaxID=1529436 RepID=UPI0014259708|nr:protein mono-ADP-ribosyltransferase PARP14-like isoform X2 [Anneissia japonica]
MLGMYFESKRSGGGEIMESRMHEDRSKFTVTFADEKVVDRLLHRDHVLDKTSLKVQRPQKTWQYKQHVDKSVVEVRGDTSTELLQMYFENKKSGGDGREVKVVYHKNKNVWTAKFDNQEIADRVLKKTHQLNGKDIKVSRPQPKRFFPGKRNIADRGNKQEEEEIIALEVENVNPSISEEFLRFYFEDNKKSGGGPIVSMQKNQKIIGNWTIQFEGSGVAQDVAKRKQHELSGSILNVKLGKKRARRPLVNRFLLISDLPKKLNPEIFNLYLEKVTRKYKPNIKFGKDPSKAMVEYKDPIEDIDDVIARIEEQQLQYTKINAKKVFEVDTIIVKNFDMNYTEEMFRLYFENHGRSGGGKIYDMQLDDKRSEVTIQFENYAVVKSVLKQKQHQLQKKDLEVCLYYDEIGEFVSDGCQWKPDPVSIPVDPYLSTFALTTPNFNDNMSNAGIEIEHNPDDPYILKLHASEGLDLNSISVWEDYAASNFKRFFSEQFHIKTLDIGDECFEDFQKYLNENEKNTKDVKLLPNDSSPSLMILGFKDAVKSVWDRLSQELKKMKDEIERKKKTITERKQYKPIKIKQIHLLRFEEVALSNYGVTMTVDEHSNMVSFEGLREDVNSAILGLYKELENFAEISFPLSAEICQFLTDCYDKIISVHADNNLYITYEIDGNRVKIYSTSNDDAMTAKSSIVGMIKHHEYLLPSDKLKVMNSVEGKQLLVDSNSPNIVTVQVVAHKEAASCIMITGFDMAVRKVIKNVDEFLSTNQIMEKRKVLERGMVRLLEKHHSKALDAIESTLKKYFVQLKPSEKNNCIVIRGNRSGIDAATEKIVGLESDVVIGKHLISQPGMATFFKDDKGRKSLESVENDCKCIIEFDGGYCNTTKEKQILLRHRLKSGIELIVCKEDMTKMNVDVIVNAANDRLQHVGGLAKAIVDAGGKEIQKESDKIMTARGNRKLITGEVIVTDAGNLPCKKIIHAVGPRYTDQTKAKSKRLLMSAVMSVYEEAEKRGLTSIGMPAISAGIYGYPLKSCTQTILGATKEYFDENPRSKIEKVYFLSVDIKVCQELKASMEMVFQIVQKDEYVVMLDDDDGDNGEYDNSDDDSKDLIEAGAVQATSKTGLKIKSDVVTTREGLDIRLIKGKIEESKADVIVNTTSRDLNLDSGNVSKALLKAAGSQLQQECDAFKAASGGTIPLEGFVETGPAALKCKKVFHTSSNQYQGQKSIQDMRKLLQILFSSASDMKSIAIPALGTGNLKYPADVVANIMYEEAINFSSNRPHSSLREIKFVVFHKDSKTIRAFETEIKDLKKGGKKLKKTLKSADRSVKDQAPSPYEGFRRVNELCAKIEVAGVTVTILQGDITENDADAIVNVTSPDFDFKFGAVPRAILKRGGKSIQTECQKNMKHSTVDEVWTGPGKLNCDGICHIPNNCDFKQVLVRVLITVEKMRKKSLAFPAIGTGASKPPRESAMLILDCICSFTMKQKPTNLRDIRIIVYEKPMTTEFISVMKEIEGKPLQQRNIFQKGFDYVMSWVGAGEGQIADGSSVDPTVTLKILAMNKDQIQDAKGKIQLIISTETTEKIIRKGVLNRFTKRHISKLKEICAKYEVEVDVSNMQSNEVELRGRTTSVLDAHGEVLELFNKIHEEEREQKENELILKEVKWYYASDENDMEKFEDEIVILLEKAYRKKENKVKYDASNNHTYEVDLKLMEETDLNFQRTVPVVRRDLSESQNLPVTWSPMMATEKIKVVDLSQGKEYQDIQQQFVTSLAGQFTHQSIKISRIQNIELWKQYAAKKEAFEKGMPGQPFERVLYHGTDESTIDKINNGGFNRSYAGKNATMYGVGTYFAVSAGYSARDQYSKPNAKREKHIFLCHVLVGKFTQGQQGLLAPPPQPNSIETYHSVVDNLNTPGIFVIFNDVQAYPSYLITFT